jgi:hypothetical protein
MPRFGIATIIAKYNLIIGIIQLSEQAKFGGTSIERGRNKRRVTKEGCRHRLRTAPA